MKLSLPGPALSVPLWLTLLVLMGSSVGWAADKEEREPAEPSLSADGMRLVYVQQVTLPGEAFSTKGEVWTVELNGGAAKRLTQGFDDKNPQFSPDGKQIVFERDGDIWLINSDGTHARNFSNTKDLIERKIVFSNDGQSLFFLQDRFGISSGIVQQPVAGGEKRERLSDDYDVIQVAPDRNDDKVIFALCNRLTPGGNPQETEEKAIAVIPLDGNPPRTLYDPRGLYEIESFCSGGGRIALFASPKDDLLDTRTYLLQDGALEKVGGTGFNGTAFSADGKTLVGKDLNDKIEWDIAFYFLPTKMRTFLKDKVR